ncbi:hypothetical protein FLJC2902T_08160 [Flavobacterium limnosediminis JC2902]|uniref:Outer membrane protein beta-barrel domain-containing protein n=1 Tax=Flavobacterium limnosediminis JC2902 TaxID=1341181 RepID=V6SYC0_9FLAO|nr:hypothetical protein [Flavobacterium limnosediminis]ESU29415.1 hypothetical protein FLJC2902T_08160 [Flavobacterium limnosediminis JC2902]
MQKIIFYVVLSLCFFVSKVTAQETFEQRAKAIAKNIETITKEEKLALKEKVDDVNEQLEAGKLTQEEADKMKIELATTHAKNIEERVGEEQEKLNVLVQEKVDGRLKDTIKMEKKISFSIPGDYDNYKKTKRTTSQFVLAFGVNNLVTNGAIANSDFGYWRSTFYEWGITGRTRLGAEDSPVHFKYGFSFMYNILHATDNRYFVDKGEETVLETFPVNLKDDKTYFKNVFFSVPLHLEFDFSKKREINGKMYRRSHKGFRFGTGGFVGINTNSKQFLGYDVDGYEIKERQKGDWNVNEWTYGLSTYVGYKNTSLYLKYDLQPMFENNAVDQNNISLGLRFDFN